MQVGTNDPEMGYLTSMKEQIASIYNLTLNTFKYFGFIGSDGYAPGSSTWGNEAYLNEFCQSQWRNYRQKETFYLNSSTYSSYSSSYSQDSALIFDEKLFQLRVSSNDIYLDVYNLKSELLASNKLSFYLNFTSTNYPRVNFKRIFALNSGKIFIILSFYTSYSFNYNYLNYLIQFSASYPFEQLESTYIKVQDSSSLWSKYLHNKLNDQIYLFNPQNLLNIFDSSLANIANVTAPSDYLTSNNYKHNGKYFYYSDGKEIKRLDDAKMEMISRKVKKANITLSEFTMVNQCLIAGFTRSQEYNPYQGYYSYFIRSHFIYFDGQEGYVPVTITTSSSSSNLVAFNSANGRIYLFDVNDKKIYVIGYD